MFDSGVGGLTVARAVIDLLPYEDLVYFGDTARCPYGPRPVQEVRTFALDIMDALVAEDVKLLVVACNSAASAALAEARHRYSVPIISVIEPGMQAGIAATRNRKVAVIGTEATIASGSYDDALAATRANVRLFSKACPAFVDFVERGETASEKLFAIAEEYLAPLRDADVDTVILGCTHYPLLSGVIQEVMGADVVLISSAEATAKEVFKKLHEDGLLNGGSALGTHRFIASSERGISSDLGVRFLGPEFTDVEYRPWSHSGHPSLMSREAL
jgi:glutamate racemase